MGFTLHNVPRNAKSKRIFYTVKDKHGVVKETDTANQGRVIEVDHGDTVSIRIELIDKEGNQL